MTRPTKLHLFLNKAKYYKKVTAGRLGRLAVSSSEGFSDQRQFFYGIHPKSFVGVRKRQLLNLPALHDSKDNQMGKMEL
jgi:hypothetical protein